eukprot:9428571-Pyramimonas_sp.AAC.1
MESPQAVLWASRCPITASPNSVPVTRPELAIETNATARHKATPLSTTILQTLGCLETTSS